MSSRKRGIRTLDQNSSRARQPEPKDLREKLNRRSKSSNQIDSSDLSNSTPRCRNESCSRESENGPREKLGCSSKTNSRVDRQSSKTHGHHKSGETLSRTSLDSSRSRQNQNKNTTKKANDARSKSQQKNNSRDKNSKNRSRNTTPSTSKSTSKSNKGRQRSHPKQNEAIRERKRSRSNDSTNNSRKGSIKRRHSPSTKTHQPNKKPRKKINPFIRYNDRLTRLLSNDPSEIIMALLNDHEDFCEFLKGKDLSAKSIEEILEILCKLYDTPYTQNFRKIFAVFQDSAFLKHLRLYILMLPYSQNDREKKRTHLERIIRLFNELLSWFPDKCEDFPLDVLFTYADQCITIANNDSSSNKSQDENGNDINENESPDDNITHQSTNTSVNKDQEQEMKDSILRLKSLRQEILQRKLSPTNKSVVKNTPPDDYKSIPIFPRREDIFPDNPPYLRKNIVRGRYDDVIHYLDVQFRLLREDYIAPIRAGVLEVTDTREYRTRSIHVYRNVKVVGRLLDTKSGGLLHRVQFDASRMRRVNWKHSKRFKYGSLYCLIDNNTTSTMYFVTITDRDPKELRNGFLKVKFFEDNLAQSIDVQQQFCMIESPAYFESYRHVLEGLQHFNKNNLPFQRYLVECKSDVRPPVYLNKSANPILSLNETANLEVTDRIRQMISGNKSSHGSYDLTKALSCKIAVTVPVLDPTAWPSQPQVDLNESQYNALKAALTQEFVVIQGPPGTGKTFVGLRIASGLLTNKSIWRRRKPLTENEAVRNESQNRSPILVVCYTNHALDQFLEGILQITDSIARVGQRGKSESLKRFNLNARKKMSKESLHCQDLKNKLKHIQAKIEEERQIIEAANKQLLPKEVEKILSDEEKEQLEQWQRVADQMRIHRIEAWRKMQDEADDGSRNKRKRSNSKTDEMKCNNLTAKRSRKTLDSAKNLNHDGLNPSSVQETNLSSKNSSSLQELNNMSLCRSAENAEEKNGGLNELEEGELPESDDEVFYQNNDTPKGHSMSNEDSTRINENNKLKTADQNYDNCEGMDEGFPYIRSEENDFGLTITVVPKTAKENSDNEGDEGQGNDFVMPSPGSISDNEVEIVDTKDTEDNNAASDKNESSGTGNSEKPNNIFTEDAEEGEIFDTDDDISDSDDTSKDGDEGGDIDLTAIIGRGINLIRKNQENYKEGVEHKLGVGEEVTLAEGENQYNEEAYQVDLKALSEEQRSNLYQEWVARYFEYHREKINSLQERHDKTLQQKSEIESIQVEGILKNVDVIGMTTTGAAKHRLTLQEIKPRIVIVEEAAEVLEGHVITALSSGTDHLILIGDHKQLKPNPTVYELARKYNLEVSLFERMVNNGLTCHSLNTQHRMRPDVADIMRIIYPNLVDDRSVQRYDNITGIQHNVYFIDHQQPESGNEELKSPSNEHEVDFVVALCTYLLLQGYEGNSITVLTMYTGQLLKLQHRIRKESFEGIRISSVDNFQGEESDIIILSLVRSNKSGKIGFLNIPNRVCVALSRAKKAMYCIGNISMMAKKNKLWNKIKNHLHNKSMIGTSLPLCCPKHPEKKIEATSAEDFKKAPQGGCMSPCGFRLPCGHACRLYCHPVDPKHEKYCCAEKCLEELCDLKHRCKKQCHFGEECEPCKEVVSYVVPSCEHEIQIECNERGKITCPNPCTKKLSCGHQCTGKCGEDCCSISCRTKVTRTLKCGHTVSMPCSTDVRDYKCTEPCEKLLDCGHKCPGDCFHCYEGRFHVKCEEPCKRLLVCSHECKEPCTKYCPPCEKLCKNRCNHSTCPNPCGKPCTPCKMLCMWKCEHYKCSTRCGEMCDREKCNEPCLKPLKCGHQCVGVCGDFCPRLCRFCDKEKLQTIFLGNEDEPDALYIELVDCGHVFEVTDLDYWMEGMQDSETAAVQLKVCPRCKTAIRRSLRYGNIVKQTLADVEHIKEIKLEEQRQLQEKRVQLKERVKELTKKYPQQFIRYGLVAFRLDRLRSDADAYNTLENKLQFFSSLCEIDEMFFTGPEKEDFVARASKLLRKKKQIYSQLREKTLLTNQEVKDISENIAFFTLGCQFEYMLWKIDEDGKSSALSEEIKSRIESAKEIMSRQDNAVDTPLAVTDDERAVVASVIESVSRNVGISPLSPKERDDIVKALKLSKGHWYKCPNGHKYVITECGGAMETRKCPECQEVIGGSNHRLAEGNQVASEMDGAKHAAWSDQANLLNYDPEELRRLQR